MRYIWFTLLLCVCVLTPETIYSIDIQKEAQAFRVFSKPKIDGKLDDSVWIKAKPVSDFIQKHPRENTNPREKTEVRFIYDSENLYIGARMFRAVPDSIVAYVAKRDNPGMSERIIVVLDSYNDKKTAYSFSLSAKGTRTDYYHSTDAEYDRDYEYNPVWSGKTNIDSIGWTAEFCIPFNQLKFNEWDVQNWGLNMNQYTPSSREDIYWVLIPKNEAGWSSRFGKLTGIKGITGTRHVEFLPYITGGALYDNTLNNRSFREKTDFYGNFGLDAKMDISPNMTLTATINPDFGQIEADPAVINLTEFETYYDEKRPFFIENRKLFERSGSNYFYSRRIGAKPHYIMPGTTLKSENNTTILSALKLTGRTGTGMSYGVLSTLTDNEYGTYKTRTPDSTLYTALTEPLTLYNVFRLQQELDKKGSFLGFQATSTNRKMLENSPISDFLNKSAYSGGLDFTLFFANKKYSLDGILGGSHITGSQYQISQIQKSSAHYFQRPDANHLEYDSTRTSLSGILGSINFAKISGEHWLWSIGTYAESPGLELNDLGRLMHSDEISTTFNIAYRENKPKAFYNSYKYNLMLYHYMNWDYITLYRKISPSFTLSFNDDSRIYASFTYNLEGLSDTKTRGGPLMSIPSEKSLYLDYSSDVTKDFRYYIAYYKLFRNSINKLYESINMSFSYNFERLKITFEPSYDYSIDPQQYIKTININNDANNFKRYIFSKLIKTTLSSALRLEYAITPDLTIDLYAEPFVSNGDFNDFGELTKGTNDEIKFYGQYPNSTISYFENGDALVADNNTTFLIENRDFRYFSFRSNLVLRWEWLPGSTLYFLAQINNEKYESRYYEIDPITLGKSISVPGKYYFALKVSYWLPYHF